LHPVAEGSIKLPNYPVMFIKPPNAIADYGQDIEIPKIAQDSQADYEGELVVIIGRDCKDVAKEDAMQHVLGYTVGNDVSTR
jgi:2-keto-4-pentenoate hydratase/2-oxohepta-3-ene-1,7-dioic acid hydratase in catechol pathway